VRLGDSEGVSTQTRLSTYMRACGWWAAGLLDHWCVPVEVLARGERSGHVLMRRWMGSTGAHDAQRVWWLVNAF